MRRILIVLLALLFALPAFAELTVERLISDNMVLQRGIPCPLWGWADAKARVTATIDGKSAKTTTSKDGTWRLSLPEHKAGGPFDLVVTSGTDKLAFKNVMYGDVWVCGGQSNMRMANHSGVDKEKIIAAANHPNLRLFLVDENIQGQPVDRLASGTWKICTPRDVAGFSAVAYHFGREIHAEIGVPVGLLLCCVGATCAEAWLPREFLGSDPEFAPIVKRYDEGIAKHPNAWKEYAAALKDYYDAMRAAKKAGQAFTRKRPRAKPMGDKRKWASGCYNGMLKPVIGYGIKGAIWYQGESNWDRGYQYRRLFPGLIGYWRKAWNCGEFPFLYVQLAGFGGHGKPKAPGHRDPYWPEVREAQMLSLSTPKVAMAVAVDVGEERDIHPRDKRPVGHRLALGALKVAYGKDLIYSGPIYKSAKIRGNQVVISFDHVAEGLKFKGEAKGFEIAAADKKYVPAQAKIEGNQVVVWADGVSQPAAARYAWDNWTPCPLYNSADLPASPFRTDTWKPYTFGKK